MPPTRLGRLWTQLLAPFLRDPDPEGQAFDTQYGTETHWYDLGNYEATPPSVVEAALDAVPAPLEGLTFVDLGAGKGRVVLLASRRPFRASVGIEHSAGLHAVSQQNRLAFGAHARCPVHLLLGDVVEQPFPEGSLLVWMFNPFPAEVVSGALRHLSRQTEHWLVYVLPLQLAAVKAAGFRPVVNGGPKDCRWEILHRPAQT